MEDVPGDIAQLCHDLVQVCFDPSGVGYRRDTPSVERAYDETDEARRLWPDLRAKETRLHLPRQDRIRYSKQGGGLDGLHF